MRRGPRSAAARNGSDKTMVEKAHAAYAELPDWVEELASYADGHGLKSAGTVISYSPATVSQVISNSYRGDLARVEEMVRGALMAVNVTCPVLGEIGRNACLSHQKAPLSTASPSSVRLFHACRGKCSHRRESGGRRHA